MSERLVLHANQASYIQKKQTHLSHLWRDVLEGIRAWVQGLAYASLCEAKGSRVQLSHTERIGISILHTCDQSTLTAAP